MGCIVSKLFLDFYIFFYIYKAPKTVCVKAISENTHIIYFVFVELPKGKGILPDRVHPVFVQVVSPKLGLYPLPGFTYKSSFIILKSWK